MNNTNTTVPTESFQPFTNLEKILILGVGITVILFVLQSVCFIICIIKFKRKQKQNRALSLKSSVKEPLTNEENVSERYSSRPLKQLSSPELYESLKDLKQSSEAPPLPPISTLPRRKPENHVQDKELVNSIATRPRLPLPNEAKVPQLSSKNNNFATMPRLPYNKPAPPAMSSTLSRYPNSETPHTLNRHNGLPRKPEIPPPIARSPSSFSHHISKIPPDFRSLPKPKSPREIQNRPTHSPFEQNNEVENELLQKLKKRAQLSPLSPAEVPLQQITNNTTRTQPQPIKNEPYNELMHKLKKRAALLPDSQNQQMQQRISPVNQAPTPKPKPLPPTPRQSDYLDGWVDDFDTIEPLEQIHMYNV